MSQHFASDNNAGMCPAALDALIAANAAGHMPSYGEDPYTARAKALIRDLLEAPQAVVHFAFNGTAANALALAQLNRPYHAVIAHSAAHIANHEAGAPGFFSGGGWLMTVATPDGRLSPDAVEPVMAKGLGAHSVKPNVLSLTQATELGTVYAAGEIAALAGIAHRRGLKVHMDGARFANAVAALGCAPADISWRAGIDVLCLGGVKNGLGVGEAVVFFDPGLAHELEWRVKQAGHLNSKMWLATAPWVALIENGVWLANARHANAMARRLAEGIANTGLRLLQPVEANGVFVEMPTEVQAAVHGKGWRFNASRGETYCRLMCAWDTAPATVDRFVADVAEAARLRRGS